MKNILKAEIKKLSSAPFIYILLALTIALPFLNNAFLALLKTLVSEAEVSEIFGLLSGSYVYATSFSPLNNIGLLVIITVVVLGANDFSQNTIRNKIIAGYAKNTIFFASLVYNLLIMFSLMFLYSSSTYLFNGLFFGFKAEDFKNVVLFGVIAFSSLAVIYTLITTLTYHFKNIVAPLLLSLGILLGLFALYSLLNMIPKHIIDFSFLIHVFPVITLISPSFSFNVDSLSLGVHTTLWWVDLLVNLGHVAWLVALGLRIANKTDYK